MPFFYLDLDTKYPDLFSFLMHVPTEKNFQDT